MLAGEGAPAEVVKKHGFQVGFQVVSDDGALEKAVDEALAANPDIVEIFAPVGGMLYDRFGAFRPILGAFCAAICGPRRIS